MQTLERSKEIAGYRVRYQELPAFDLTGFTKIVASGGELYDEVRADGKWEVLRTLGGDDMTIYGVASFDKECTKDHYRYTLAVKSPLAERLAEADRHGSLFKLHILESEWLVVELEHFMRQYGVFWQADPYALVQKLGWSFNSRVGLHIDMYGPSYSSDDDAMEFMMPVKRSA